MKVRNNNTKSYNPSFKGIRQYVANSADVPAIIIKNKIKNPEPNKLIVENPFYADFQNAWIQGISNSDWAVKNLKSLGFDVKPPKLLNPEEKVSVFVFTGKEMKKLLKKFYPDEMISKPKKNTKENKLISGLKQLLQEHKCKKALEKENFSQKIDLFESLEIFPQKLYGKSQYAQDRLSAHYFYSHDQRHQRDFKKFLKDKKVETVDYDSIK